MCSTPSIPSSTKTETIATPTAADASVTKAGAEKRKQIAQNAGRDIKTSVRGETEKANTQKKKLLGE